MHSELHEQARSGPSASAMKLNLGCGSQIVDGWVNVDYAMGARLNRLPLFRLVNKRLHLFKNVDWDERIFLHDLATRFPWPDSSVDVVYSSHTLEHFNKEQGLLFLRECHRVLRPGGIIRILVPDLRCMIDDYLNGNVRADDFVNELSVLPGNHLSGLKNRLVPLMQSHHTHKCMYDSGRLVEILGEIGFTASSRGAFDSDIDDVRAIERESRTQEAVVVEGRKRPGGGVN